MADEVFAEAELHQLAALVAQGRLQLQRVAGVSQPEPANQPAPEPAADSAAA